MYLLPAIVGEFIATAYSPNTAKIKKFPPVGCVT